MSFHIQSLAARKHTFQLESVSVKGIPCWDSYLLKVLEVGEQRAV